MENDSEYADEVEKERNLSHLYQWHQQNTWLCFEREDLAWLYSSELWMSWKPSINLNDKIEKRNHLARSARKSTSQVVNARCTMMRKEGSDFISDGLDELGWNREKKKLRKRKNNTDAKLQWQDLKNYLMAI